jgi:hypothetical protein
MLPLFQHEKTRAVFVLHYETAAARKGRRGPTKPVQVKFAPVTNKKPREAAWAEYRKTGKRYH